MELHGQLQGVSSKFERLKTQRDEAMRDVTELTDKIKERVRCVPFSPTSVRRCPTVTHPSSVHVVYRLIAGPFIKYPWVGARCLSHWKADVDATYKLRCMFEALLSRWP